LLLLLSLNGQNNNNVHSQIYPSETKGTPEDGKPIDDFFPFHIHHYRDVVDIYLLGSGTGNRVSYGHGDLPLFGPYSAFCSRFILHPALKTGAGRVLSFHSFLYYEAKSFRAFQTIEIPSKENKPSR
jgi:hypothetical protein